MHTHIQAFIESRATRKEKIVGLDGLVNTISDLKRVSTYNIRIYLNYCHKLAQNRKNKKILFPFFVRI